MKNLLLLFFIITANISFAGETKEVAIVILPEKACSDIASDVNKRANFLTKTENQINDIWHIPLYETVLDTDNIESIQSELNLIKIPAFSFMIQNLTSESDKKIIYSIIPERKIQSLHELVVHITMKKSAGILERVKDEFPKLTIEQKEQSNRYGSYGLLKQFSPKLVVFYSQNEDPALASAAATLAKTTPQNILCKVDSLSIVELGYNGQALQILSSRTIP